MRKQERRSAVMHTLVVLDGGSKSLKTKTLHASASPGLCTRHPCPSWNAINLEQTITAQEIVKFTASAGLDAAHLKFTKSHNVVISQMPQERSVRTERRTKKRRRQWKAGGVRECGR